MIEIIQEINDNAQDSLAEIKDNNEKQLKLLNRFFFRSV